VTFSLKLFIALPLFVASGINFLFPVTGVAEQFIAFGMALDIVIALGLSPTPTP